MTVRDLIKELEDLPMDLPVVNDFKEIERVSLEDSFYYLDSSPERYFHSDVIVLS